MNSIGRALIAAGCILVLSGVLLLLLGRYTGFFGKLPGDISFSRKGLTVFAPFTSMIILSVLLTVVINIIFRFLK
ncbi:MAG: DUF2905 domain-containing protein [Synergistaceae bacterium]|nr:DUF2905 domain-containing protein [Synergistota bacterium]NLM71663.1 DUF2905 domain-containing protein [Synergistaceae bacterium]